MITEHNLVNHEMIGLKTKIKNSSNQQLVGLDGIIIDESKSMFKIKTKNGIKSIPKSINSWVFELDKGENIIDGIKIQKRSHERMVIKL